MAYGTVARRAQTGAAAIPRVARAFGGASLARRAGLWAIRRGLGSAFGIPAALVAEGIAKAFSSRRTQTSAGSAQRVRPKGKRYGNSRWTGYVRATKYKRRRSAKRTSRSIDYGYQVSAERGGSVAPTLSGLVAHATSPRVMVQRAMFGSLLRLLFKKANVQCNPPNAAVYPLVTDTVIEFDFVYGATTGDGFSMTITAGATLTQIVDAAISAFNAKYDALAANVVPGNLRFRTMILRAASGTPSVPASGSVFVDLNNCKLAFWCTSRLKLQNRSITTTGENESDDVDNVPVNCVVYEGYGSGTDGRYNYGQPNPVAIATDTTTGLLTVSNPENMLDAPLPVMFPGAKRSGFFRIQPGSIKTHVLKYRKTISLESLCRMILIPRGDTRFIIKLGKFGMVHFEKTMESNQSSPVAMNIAFESQLFMSVKAFTNYSEKAVPEFIRS